MAIYRFTDTIERALRNGYPAEALNFNGIYFEDEIEGYQTLSVSGREALEAEVDYIETKARHGAKYRSSRYLPRVITVRYKIRAKDSSDLIEKYNRLNYLLGVEEAKLIFRDEPDKFWIGTRRNLTPPEGGLLTTTGEIEFLCADPFKYSVKEFVAAAVNNSISIRYSGTQPNPPVFRVLAHGDVALIELLKDTARVVCGTGYDISKSRGGAGREIFNTKTDAMGFKAMDPLYDWRTLTTYIPEVTGVLGRCEVPPVGSTYQGFWRGMDMESARYYETETIDGETWLIPYRGDNDFFLLSNGESESVVTISGYYDETNVYDPVWIEISSGNEEYYNASCQLRGGAMQYDINMTCNNFEMDFESRIYAEMTNERGAQAFTVYGTRETTTIDGNIATITQETVKICGLVIQKSAIGTNRLEVSVYIGDNKVDTIVMSATSDNPVFGKNSRKCSFSRFGGVYTLRLGNETYTYQTSEAIIPTYMTVYMLDYTGLPVLQCNAVRYIRFVEHTAESSKAVASIIHNGDEVVIDCTSAEITVNGINEPELGDITNQWDEMDLVPGENNIGINMIRSASEKEPEVTMLYREAYI